MSRIEPYIQLRYWGLWPSPELEATIAASSARLSPYRDRIESCELHIGRWSRHHEQGLLFRATLSIEPAGGGAAIAMEEETEVGAPVAARTDVLETGVARAASGLR